MGQLWPLPPAAAIPQGKGDATRPVQGTQGTQWVTGARNARRCSCRSRVEGGSRRSSTEDQGLNLRILCQAKPPRIKCFTHLHEPVSFCVSFRIGICCSCGQGNAPPLPPRSEIVLEHEHSVLFFVNSQGRTLTLTPLGNKKCLKSLF